MSEPITLTRSAARIASSTRSRSACSGVGSATMASIFGSLGSISCSLALVPAYLVCRGLLPERRERLPALASAGAGYFFE
jgi:hypothetical protein